MRDLIDRLEQAAGPAIVLDAELFWRFDRQKATTAFWRGAMGLPKPLPEEFSRLPRGLGMASLEASSPNYTASLDAAVALAKLVLPRWGMDVGFPGRLGEHGGRPWADCWPPVEDGETAPFRLGGPRPTPHHSNAATPALAVCISICRAKSGESA